jgi:hypothetical protein
MPLAFLMDQHVPGPIVRGLRVRGIDAVTAFEERVDRLPDDELLARATELGRVLVTQDDDLLAIAHRWQVTGRGFSGLIYCHQLNITIGRAIAGLEVLALCCTEDEFLSVVQFLPLT